MKQLTLRLISNFNSSSSSSSVFRCEALKPFLYRRAVTKPDSSSSSFIKQSLASTSPSIATLSQIKCIGVRNMAKWFSRVGANSAGCRLTLFRPGFPKRGFGLSSSQFTRGWRSRLSRLSSDDVVLGLIVANVAVFMLWRVADQDFMFNNFTLSLHNIKCGRVHTMITSAFSHIDVGHIVSNMVGLYFFGTSIGRYFGSEYLLKLYLAGAFGGSFLYLIQSSFMTMSSEGGRTRNSSNIPALGASGAVNAIMLLNIFLYPRATLYIDFIIPVPAILLGIFLIGKDMLRLLEGDEKISGSAHLGGAVVAAIAWKRIKMGRF
uniref:Peptidase S54 rhomboid domain-containing protein n=1 Tax=Kalanchoe fedtschenkoi TaxID=63787 RepID=A0A7N0VF00_KALFE